MGVFNDLTTTSSTKLDSYAINIYCIVSALFFSACGYAQLNDPSPILWFLAYIVGGTVPNLYWITIRSTCTISNGGNSNGGNTNTSQYNSKQKYVLQLLLFYGFISILSLCILYKMITVAPKLFADVTQHHSGIVWAFMEHEEGRDSCGLLLLLLHVLYMNTVLSRTTDPTTQSSRRKSETSTTTYKRFISIICSPTILSLILLMVLGISIYTWIVHHPDMVAKYGVPHCQGTMFGREDNHEL